MTGDRLAQDVAEVLHDVTVALATLRQAEDYGPCHWAVKGLERLTDELMALWASWVEYPAPETRRRIEEVLGRWFHFDPGQL